MNNKVLCVGSYSIISISNASSLRNILDKYKFNFRVVDIRILKIYCKKIGEMFLWLQNITYICIKHHKKNIWTL